MGTTDNYVNVVKKAFPANSKSIEELFAQNGEFRSLCEEYNACLHHLLKNSRELSEKKEDLADYEFLFKELSKELQDFIEQFDGNSKSEEI